MKANRGRKTLCVLLAACMSLAGMPAESNMPQSVTALDAASCVFHSTFESGTEQWTARGGNTVSVSASKAYAGSQSLYVSGRTSAWHGAGYSLDSSRFVAGNTYSFGVKVMQNAIAAEDFKLSLQYEADGEPQ